jgi:hypothetical protein
MFILHFLRLTVLKNENYAGLFVVVVVVVVVAVAVAVVPHAYSAVCDFFKLFMLLVEL